MRTKWLWFEMSVSKVCSQRLTYFLIYKSSPRMTCFRSTPQDNHWLYHCALVVGQNCFEAALLIEPSQPSKLSTTARAELIENFWPVVEEANQKASAYARVSKSHILFTSPEKPMSRAGKGTVLRRFTVEDYSAKIDAIYTDAETTNNSDSSLKIDLLNMKQPVHQIVAFTMCLEDLGLKMISPLEAWTLFKLSKQ